MRFILGLIFGLLLGGVLAMLLAAQAAGEPDDSEMFGLDDPAPNPMPAGATPTGAVR